MAIKTFGKGWREEPERHRLSALGIKTGRRSTEKTPLILKTILPHVPMTLGLTAGSKEFLERRGREKDVLDTLNARGWNIKWNKFAPTPGAWDAYKGKNYIELVPTHWKKVKIDKIILTDPNEARILRRLFRKPYPYKIPDYARRLPVVKIGNKKYFVDARLNELRNIKNPFDVEKMEGSEEFYVKNFGVKE